MNRLFWIVMLVIGAGVILLMMNDSAGRTFGIENHDFSRLIWVGVLVAVIGA
ncbi:MAG: TIGR02281 family clan AA aspartic protease, partial [Mesorhizobium sp.]